MNAKRIGRPMKPYQPTFGGDPIAGLCRQPDGRWRIAATGQRFTEPDERTAIMRFMQWKETQDASRADYVDVPLGDPTKADAIEPVATLTKVRDDGILVTEDTHYTVGQMIAREEVKAGKPLFVGNVKLGMKYELPKAIFMRWLRAQLTDQASLNALAKDLGVPALAGLWSFIPKQPVKLQDLLDTYKQHSDVTPQSKSGTCATFSEFMEMTGAATLDDLTVDALSKYRDAIRSRLASPGSIAGYFGRVKWVIRHGQAYGHDAKQISEALDRMAVLKAPKDRRVHTPSPVTRADWDKLYKAVKGKWQAVLLLMLNCCLHFEEALDLEWTDFDLEKGTYCTLRNRTGRVIRAAMLWPETVAALKAIERTGSPFVFVSNRGTRFGAKGQWKVWNRLRKAAGCSHVQLDDIRDGAYTAACNATGVDEKFARLLAGHRSHGLQDSYVQRNPAIVKSACEAVYKIYLA